MIDYTRATVSRKLLQEILHWEKGLHLKSHPFSKGRKYQVGQKLRKSCQEQMPGEKKRTLLLARARCGL